MSKIEWTDATWNSIVGCSFVSAGCANCYAARMADRLASMGLNQYEMATSKGGWIGQAVLVDSAAEKPLRWKRPRRVFVNSMGDLFHESVPFEWIDRVIAVIALCPQHTFQILTKRPLRMKEYYENCKEACFKEVWIPG